MDIIKSPKQLWFIADPHFDHASLVHGSNHGDPARPFLSVAAMNEAIVANFNDRVRPRDHWYLLGDVAMHSDACDWLLKLNGHGRLILGNHDREAVTFYLRFVKKVMAYREFDGMLFSHIAVAPWSHRWTANVHGHSHGTKPLFYDVTNPDLVGFGRRARYINISLENTQYRPVPLEDLSKWSRR